MGMIIVPAPFGGVFLDMLEPLTSDLLDALEGYRLPDTATGITGFVRYLENLTSDELQDILSRPSNYGVMLVGESRANGYIPSAAEGQQDAEREVNKARALSIPPGVTITCDLEGMGGTAQDTIDYANTWAAVAQGASDVAMAYVGDGVPLTSQQLQQLRDTLYWHSLSSVQPVAGCDYAMIQGYPTQNLPLPNGGVLPADVNFVYRDKRGRGPTMVKMAA